MARIKSWHAVPIRGSPHSPAIQPFSDKRCKAGKSEPRPDRKHAVRHLLNPVGNADTVQRLKLQRTENEQIQYPCNSSALFGMDAIVSTLDIACQYWRSAS